MAAKVLKVSPHFCSIDDQPKPLPSPVNTPWPNSSRFWRRNEVRMCLENTCSPQEVRISRAKTSSACMRLERCARERPCSLKCLRAPHPTSLRSSVCSHPARSEINRSHPVGSGTFFSCVSNHMLLKVLSACALNLCQSPHLNGLDRLCAHIQHAQKINRSHPVGPGTSFSCVSNHMLPKVLSACA